MLTSVYDAAAVPQEVWEGLQDVHHESLKAQLPEERWGEADRLVHLGDPENYINSRVDPNILVGNAFNADQIFRRPLVAVTRDSNGEIIGGVVTADNSSASLPLPSSLRQFEYRAKMALRPGLPVPLVGNKRYVHIREVYTHPDLLDPNDELIHMATLSGIYHSLADRRRAQYAAVYVFPRNPIDTELTLVSTRLQMLAAGEQKHALPSYDREDKLIRARRNVGAILDLIEDTSRERGEPIAGSARILAPK
jgi:hypothetical protein